MDGANPIGHGAGAHPHVDGGGNAGDGHQANANPDGEAGPPARPFVQGPPGGHGTGSALARLLANKKTTVVDTHKGKNLPQVDQGELMVFQQISQTISATASGSDEAKEAEGLIDAANMIGLGR